MPPKTTHLVVNTTSHLSTAAYQSIIHANPNRISISVQFLSSYGGNYCYCYSEKPDSSTGNTFLFIYDKQTLILSALEGDDVTGTFYFQTNTSSGLLLVKEEFATYTVIQKIKALGGKDTNDLALLLIGALILGSGSS